MIKTSLYKAFTLLCLMPFAQAQNTSTSILFNGKKTYVISDGQLFEPAKKNTLKSVLDFGQQANASLVKGSELWIATDKGVKIYDLENQVLLRSKFQDTAVAGLAVDAEEKVWVATTFKGVFRETAQDKFEKKLNAINNYCIVATADKNVYVGTNLGLYQIPLEENSQVIRYAEEAHSGHGLPDNIVENLYADTASNLWVMMPDNVSFKKSDNYDGEIPTFSFVGEKENNIYKVLGLNNENYLFITSKGVLLLPSSSLRAHAHGDEVFSGQDTNAILLNIKAISKPGHLADSPVLYAEKNKDKIYFYTANGIWKISENDIFKFLKKNKPQKEQPGS